MNMRQQIESDGSLPVARFTGRREVMLTHGDVVLTLKNADCDAFIEGYQQTLKEKANG